MSRPRPNHNFCFQTKVPISKTDLEEIIVFLTISKKGHIITGADLAECQRLWMDSLRDNWKQPRQGNKGTKLIQAIEQFSVPDKFDPVDLIYRFSC